MGNNCVGHTNQVIQVGGFTVRVRKTLARGGYGFVHLVKEVGKKQFYALKIISITSNDCLKVFQKENQVIKIIGDHPNVIKIFASEKKQEAGFILMQLAKMTLWKLLAKTIKNPLTEYQIIYILRQITAGLCHIHSKGYAHRDIKTENILIMDDGTVRICDFGSCTNEFMNTDDIKTSKVSGVEREIGKNTTWMYRPPELIDLKQGYQIDQHMDMWMLGIIAFIMAYYKSPFKSTESEEALAKEILGKQIKLPQNSTVSPLLQTFILDLLKPNPEQRLTSQQGLKYLNDNFKLNVIRATK